MKQSRLLALLKKIENCTASVVVAGARSAEIKKNIALESYDKNTTLFFCMLTYCLLLTS